MELRSGTTQLTTPYLHVTLWCCVTLLLLVGGCSLGPRHLVQTRIPYNDAIKKTGEQQLLLNLVRLRYVDTPSSLAISAIADQQEVSAGVEATPFFTSAATGDALRFRGSVLPQIGWNRASRPTLSYTPMDDEEFTRRLFTPISLDGVAYLSRTTWPISTVFRLFLENLNWVSNAETASGPTPTAPPDYQQFFDGVIALQRLQDRQVITLCSQDREESVPAELMQGQVSVSDALQCVRDSIELRNSGRGVDLVKRTRQPVMRVAPIDPADSDWLDFAQAFHLDPTARTLDLTSDRSDPYQENKPPEGYRTLDVETRSLQQVLFFAAHGIEVPAQHVACGLAPTTRNPDGSLFDWNQVLAGLLHVCHASGKHPPEHAAVVVHYRDHWFYIDQRDHQSKATFALLLEVSRLELPESKPSGPLLTLPVGR